MRSDTRWRCPRQPQPVPTSDDEACAPKFLSLALLSPSPPPPLSFVPVCCFSFKNCSHSGFGLHQNRTRSQFGASFSSHCGESESWFDRSQSGHSDCERARVDHEAAVIQFQNENRIKLKRANEREPEKIMMRRRRKSKTTNRLVWSLLGWLQLSSAGICFASSTTSDETQRNQRDLVVAGPSPNANSDQPANNEKPFGE